MWGRLQSYAHAIMQAVEATEWSGGGVLLARDDGYLRFRKSVMSVRGRGKIIFIGNGGSAAIADHMAEDYTKAGGVRAITFNNGPLLTCLANDYSFEEVFGQAVKMHADVDDLVVAISSSGKSKNILNGVAAARERKCRVVTLSGFAPGNPLRMQGDINAYVPVPSPQYGCVELAHAIILHGLLESIA